MYGPAARCKRLSPIWQITVLHQCIRPLIGACAPGHHGYQRACDLIRRQASTGPFGSPVFACTGKFEHMAIRVAKIDAAAAVPVIEPVVEAPRCAAIGE